MKEKDLVKSNGKDITNATVSSKADIRHYMAIHRTIMANERTLLAYSRTGLTLVLGGLGFIHFTNSLILELIAIAFIPIGLFTLIYGIRRFVQKRKIIKEHKTKLEPMIIFYASDNK